MVLRPVCERTAAAIRYYAQFTEVMFGKDADGASVNVPKTSSLSDYDGFLARTAPHRTAAPCCFVLDVSSARARVLVADVCMLHGGRRVRPSNAAWRVGCRCGVQIQYNIDTFQPLWARTLAQVCGRTA